MGSDSYYKNCQFNLPFIAACAIADGEVTERQFTKERISDEKLHGLAEKIKVIADEALDSIYPENRRPTHVLVRTKKGKTYEKRVDYPKGEPRNPLTDEELYDKFVEWSSLSKGRADEIWTTLLKLEEIEDVSEFMGLL